MASAAGVCIYNILRLGVHDASDMELRSQVPNIKGVEQLSVSEIAGHLGRLQQLAEEGHLHQEDLEGARHISAFFGSSRRCSLVVPHHVSLKVADFHSAGPFA